MLAHPPACDHVPGKAGHHLEIVLRAGGHSLRPKGQFFCRTASQAYGQASHEPFTAVIVAVLLGLELGHSQALPTRQDGHTIDAISLWKVVGHQGMTRLVKGDDAPLRFAQYYRTLRPEEHPRQRFLEACAGNALQVVTGSTQRRLIDEIGEVRATHPGGLPCREAVEFYQELVERLVPFIAAAEPGGSFAAYRV